MGKIEIRCGDQLLYLATPAELSAEVVFDAVIDKFGRRKKPSLVCEASGCVFLPDSGSVPVGVYRYASPAVERDSIFGKMGKPSEAGYNQVKQEQEGMNPETFNFRPATAAPPLPLQLVNFAFGRFLDAMHSPADCTSADYKHYEELAKVASAYYEDESDMADELRKLWWKYIGIYVQEEMSTGKRQRGPGSNTATDLSIRDLVCEALLALLEVKRGMSLSHTEPQAQALENFKLYYCKARQECKQRFADTGFPVFVLEHVGQMLQIGAAVTLDGHVCYQPMASMVLAPIHGHDRRMAERGAAICAALKRGVLDLQEFYTSCGNVPLDPIMMDLHKRCIPYPLHDRADNNVVIEQLHPEKRVYLVLDKATGEKRALKYAQRYGLAVHRAWAEAGYAACVFGEALLVPGGWVEVEMEYLDPEQGWELLYGHKEAEKLRKVAVECLRAAHRVEVSKEGRHGVHGDMRDNNVMVRRRGDAVEVKFIDFDWAAEEGSVDCLYPAFINEEINWMKGVERKMPMRQEHDLFLLRLRQEEQVKPDITNACFRRGFQTRKVKPRRS